jgi:hypothetical protein
MAGHEVVQYRAPTTLANSSAVRRLAVPFPFDATFTLPPEPRKCAMNPATSFAGRSENVPDDCALARSAPGRKRGKQRQRLA